MGGMRTEEQALLAMARAFAAHYGNSLGRVSDLAAGSGTLFERLARGGSCTLRVRRRVIDYFDSHWPKGLEWPDDVPRPHAGAA